MTLIGVGFVPWGGRDYHLLPGTKSPPLTPFLVGHDQDPSSGQVTYHLVEDMHDVTVSYQAHFRSTPASAFGVHLSEATGEVTVDSSLSGGRRLRTFLVTATAEQGTRSVSVQIRFYIHKTLENFWLTPSRLTVRLDASVAPRLSVLARFDNLANGCVGDISNWSPDRALESADECRHVHLATSNEPLLKWSAEPETPGAELAVTVGPASGLLVAQLHHGRVRIKLEHAGKTVQAAAEAEFSWNQPTGVVHVRPAAAPASAIGPGVAGMLDVPNVLFLPEGFQAHERSAFERLVRDGVTRLAKGRRTRPFSFLRLNYFMAWVPSPDAGVVALSDMYLDPKVEQPGGSHAVVRPVWQPDPGAPGSVWTLDDLINAVGLPIPSHDLPTTKLDDKVAEWADLYDPTITADKVRSVYDKWLKHASRRLLNERDTAFHFAFGERPRVDVVARPHSLVHNRERIEAADFNAFLDALHGPSGPSQVLPKVWSTGKDRNLVVFLCRSGRFGGVNSTRGTGRTLSVSLGWKGTTTARQAANGAGFDLVPDGVPSQVIPQIQATILHELAHSWALLDEYGGRPEPPSAFAIELTRHSANVQARESLLNASNLLVADNIKWGRWPRISKCGVLRVDLQLDLPGIFIATLVSNDVADFERGDIVRLRRRPLHESRGHSGRFEVIDVDGDHLTILALPGTDVASLPVLYPPVGGVHLDGSISPGSLLFAPARGPDPDRSAGQYGDDLTLMTAAARQRIDLTHNPLNARPLLGEAPPPHDIEGRDCPNVTLPAPTHATNFPDRQAPSPPRYSAWTIGLYENGASYNCGIYRPTGICSMGPNILDEKKGLFISDFCMVCRYAIVDLVDPTKHGRADADFRYRYG